MANFHLQVLLLLLVAWLLPTRFLCLAPGGLVVTEAHLLVLVVETSSCQELLEMTWRVIRTRNLGAKNHQDNHGT